MLNEEQREKRIEELLLLIGGCESALAKAGEDEYQFKRAINKQLDEAMEKLRRVIRGVEEQDT